jgi:hypothetical protein
MWDTTMSSIPAISTASAPKPIQPQTVSPRSSRVDSDGDHDGSRAPTPTATGRRLDVSA